MATSVLLGVTPEAQGQLSPNCLRNGKRDYCALTPIKEATSDKQISDTVVFADHTQYVVLRNETSCKNITDKIRTCNAKITKPQGQTGSAFYRGTSYEGGYKHEYVGRDIQITYFYLD
jgi:hypothetical protein